MKYFLLIIPFFYSSVISAQSIEVTPSGSSAENNVRMFSFDRSNVELRGTNLLVSGPFQQLDLTNVNSYDISGEGRFMAAILIDNDLRAWLIDGLGSKVHDIELDYFDPFDETLKIKVLDNGRFITRDNVVNFSFFDSDGTLKYSVSNSSGSAEGEVASGITTDSSGNTILLYNPRINYGAREGSRARILKGEDNFINIYDSRERTIKDAAVSQNGKYITLIVEGPGSDDLIFVADRHGNKIARLTSDMELSGVTLTEDAAYLTIYSSNRAQVYRLRDNELLGSTSFRVSVVFAAYSPEDQQILALCGTPGQNNQIQNPELHAIHLGERSIARTDIISPISYLELNHLQLKRTSGNRYIISGLNRELSIQTRF